MKHTNRNTLQRLAAWLAALFTGRRQVETACAAGCLILCTNCRAPGAR